MKKTKKQRSSAVIPVLLGVTVILVVLIGIMVYFVSSQKTQQEPEAPKAQVTAVPAAEDTSGYPDNYQIQFKRNGW